MINDPVSFIALIFLVVALTLAQMRQNTYQQLKISLKKVQRKYQIRNSFRVRVEKEDRIYYIEHLIITPAGIYLVHVEDRKGKILGSEEDEKWIDKGKRKEEEFDNPTILLDKLKKIVKEQVDPVKKDVPIKSLIVFSIRASIIDLENETDVIKGTEISNYLRDDEQLLDEPILTETDMNVIYRELRPNLYRDKEEE